MLALLLKREFLVERRTFAWAGSMGLLALQAVVILGLGFSGEGASETKTALATAALWLAFLFCGTAGMNRAFAQEREGAALTGVLLLPFDAALLYLAKVIASLAFLVAALAVIGVAAALFLALPVFDNAAALLPIIGLAALGYTAVGTLLAAMTSSLRGRDALLAIALLPIVVPLFVAATGAARDVMLGASLESVSDELLMLGAFDAIYLATGLLLFEKVLQE